MAQVVPVLPHLLPRRPRPHRAAVHAVARLDDFVSVRRRRQIVYPVDELRANAPSKQIRDEVAPYSLLFLRQKLML